MDTKRGLLAKYARLQDGRKTHSLTTKVTEQEHREFTEYAAKLHLTPSEALRFLIIEELARVSGQIPADLNRSIAETAVSVVDTTRYQGIQTYPDRSQGIRIDPPQIHKDPPRKPKSTRLPGGASRSANRWKVGNLLPCPICGKWGAATNFKRDHIEKHGLSYANAPEFLEAHKEEADRMLQEKLKEMEGRN